jgi:hypothetical protein
VKEAAASVGEKAVEVGRSIEEHTKPAVDGFRRGIRFLKSSPRRVGRALFSRATLSLRDVLAYLSAEFIVPVEVRGLIRPFLKNHPRNRDAIPTIAA